MWTFRELEEEMVLSIIVPKHAIEEVFPADRCKKLSILIRTNTAPELVGWPSATPTRSFHERIPPQKKPKERDGRKFPYYVPTQEDLVDQGPPINEKLSMVLEEIKARPRSESVARVMEAPKTPWHLFPSATRVDQPQPKWASGAGPFCHHPGPNDDAWWQEDMVRRETLLAQWRREMDELEANPPCDLEELDPHEMIAGVDYPCVPHLCDAFTSDRSDRWYRDNVEAAELRDHRRDYKVAEQNYSAIAAQVRQYYDRCTKMHIETRTRGCDPLLTVHMQNVKAAQPQMQRLMQDAEQQLYIAAKGCNVKLDASKCNLIGQLETKMWQNVHTAEARLDLAPQRAQHARPALASTKKSTAVRLPDTSMPHRIRPQVLSRAVNDDGYIIWPEDPDLADALAEAYACKTRRALAPLAPWTTEKLPTDIEPFPAYRDPMSEHQPDLAATQQDVRKPSARARGRSQRTNTARALAKVIAKTSTKQHIEEPRNDFVQPATAQPIPRKVSSELQHDTRAEGWSGPTYCAGGQGALSDGKIKECGGVDKEKLEETETKIPNIALAA
jgi:hypothetical protein